MEFTVEPCKTKAAYSVKPKRKCSIDLSKLKDFKIIAETPVAAVVEIEDEQVIVHKYGELKFKTLKDEEKIKKIAELIFSSCKIS